MRHGTAHSGCPPWQVLSARAYGFDFGYKPEPSWAVYHGLQTFGAIIRRDLDRRPGLRARDMIDVQSFIWVQGADEYEA